MDKIRIVGLVGETHLGVTEQERSRLQKVVIDLDLELDLGGACDSDRLQDSVDYSRVADDVVVRLESARYRLLESLAAEVCRAALSHSAVRKTKVLVRKFPADLAGRLESVAVEMERESQS